MYQYQSTAWIVVRGAWFFDFMGELMRLVVVDRDMPLRKVAITAYETKLAPHHPWMLRKLVSVGLNACTSREGFLKSYVKEKQELNPDTPFTEKDAY